MVDLTPSSSRVSSRWRGITVTSSISQINATSAGVRPGFCDMAMFCEETGGIGQLCLVVLVVLVGLELFPKVCME